MATIYIEGRPYEAKEGQNLLQVALSLGFDIPYFCWHPHMGSVGACRQCAVKQFRDENDTRGRLVMACMTPVTNGLRISIDDQEARDFRASVTEWLMLNHPHDCPVCDEGGECHLQDMTVMTGHAHRRYTGKKRTFRNQDLGPLVNHEMNRCIQCYRCVRFYRDVAGGRDFDAFGLRNQVYFGRAKDGVLESEFSGNLVEVCPTGVFTDKTFKEHHTRKWDLQTAPSICVHCGLGCNTIPGARYGTVRRIRNRYNGEVNGYFLCDRGRYGYEFVNSERRVRRSLYRKDRSAEAAPVEREEALRLAASLIGGGGSVIGIGSPRASLEANFALLTLVGRDNFCAGMSEAEQARVLQALEILQKGPVASASAARVAASDAALVLGEDVTRDAPLLALALRQVTRRGALKKAAHLNIPEWDAAAVRQVTRREKGSLFIAASHETRLDDVAITVSSPPADIARLAFAVAHAIDAAAPRVDGLSDEASALARQIAITLAAADMPVVVTSAACADKDILRAAANVAWALCKQGHPAQICMAVPECNSLGAGLMGGRSLDEAFETVRSGEAQTVIILENDLYRRADKATIDAFLATAEHVIVVDHTRTPTADRADLLLPAATFVENDGTLVNNEGRAQRFYKVIPPTGDVQESWRWLSDINALANLDSADQQRWRRFDDVVSALAAAMPVFAPVAMAAPSADFRILGRKIARQAARFSGRTAMLADIDVSEPQPPADIDSPLTFSMEGYQQQPPSSLIPRFWAPGWNSVQALNKFQEEVSGPLRGGDPGQRLVEPEQESGRLVSYFDAIPPAFEPVAGHWLLVPVQHVFGSEELSALAPAVDSLAPSPYLGLDAADTGVLGVEEGSEVEVAAGGWTARLPVRLMRLPKGVAALPVGLPGLGWVELPALCTLSASPTAKGGGTK
jgi:NADH-quinone oxidoreductase subunit G